MHVALVVILADPLPSPEEAVRRMCDASLGIVPEPEPEGGEHPIAGRFRFDHGGQSFRVIASDQPHPDGPDLMSRLEDPATRERVASHRGFVAVEWVESEAVPEFEASYHPIGRVLAEAISAKDTAESAIAILTPQWDRVAPVTPSTADQLASAQPLLEFGIVHTRLGCLIREGSLWISVFPSRWGSVQITATGGPSGPVREHVDRMREIAEYKLRFFRARLLFSLFYRPCQVLLDSGGEITVEYRNWLTGTRSHFVSEFDVRG